MPGKVVAVSVEAGQIVAAGDALVVMEAMKMEHTLRSSADAKVRVATGGTRTHFSCDGCAVLVIPVALAIFNHASLIFTYILMRDYILPLVLVLVPMFACSVVRNTAPWYHRSISFRWWK